MLALLQSVAMALVAYPAARATGQCLLQTSPPASSSSTQMKTLHSGLRDIENHSLVVSVDPIHVWQLTPHHPQGVSAFFIPGSPTQKRRRAPSVGDDGEGDRTTLVVTLHVKVRHDCSDEQMRDVARFAKERCKGGLRVGRGAVQGDATVQVDRAKAGQEVRYYEAPSKSVFGIEVELGAAYGDANGHSHGHEAEAHDAHAGHSHAPVVEEHGGHSHAHGGHSH